eukprot:TRINITY_DN4958_c0_g1_i4.p2 TRINITY_DN4958_c0_g1~~TRINITY_DN4958_c0_g1_i4.p2  ORF type:complete len:148 (-),score=35.55 TRINITY_DN4958_c0_g1_i4:317-760(-)
MRFINQTNNYEDETVDNDFVTGPARTNTLTKLSGNGTTITTDNRGYPNNKIREFKSEELDFNNLSAQEVRELRELIREKKGQQQQQQHQQHQTVPSHTISSQHYSVSPSSTSPSLQPTDHRNHNMVSGSTLNSIFASIRQDSSVRPM